MNFCQTTIGGGRMNSGSLSSSQSSCQVMMPAAAARKTVPARLPPGRRYPRRCVLVSFFMVNYVTEYKKIDDLSQSNHLLLSELGT